MVPFQALQMVGYTVHVISPARSHDVSTGYDDWDRFFLGLAGESQDFLQINSW